MVEIPQHVTKRAFDNWTATEDGCLISNYSVQSRGYAQIGWHDKSLGRSRGTTAHRAAWVHANGPVPEGMDVDHRYVCDRRCVNVDHLRLLTAAQNRQRQGRKYPVGYCTNGHPDSERRMTHRGMCCRICKRESERARYARRTAA